jgi:hypothetical protein
MNRINRQISSDIKGMVGKVFDGLLLTREEIVYLLRMNHQSIDAGFIMVAANAMSRKAARGQAEVHAQIGLNLSPCPIFSGRKPARIPGIRKVRPPGGEGWM